MRLSACATASRLGERALLRAQRFCCRRSTGDRPQATAQPFPDPCSQGQRLRLSPFPLLRWVLVGTLQPYRCYRRLEIEEPSRAFTLGLHKVRELGLRHAHWFASVVRDPIAKIWSGEHAPDIPRKLVNLSDRSAGRNPYSIPNRKVESGNARFSDRRHLRKQG